MCISADTPPSSTVKVAATTISDGRRDVRELGIHFRAHVLEFDLEHGLPRAFVFFEEHVKQAMDDALFGRREVAPFDPRVKASVPTEHVVDDEKHQIRVEHHEPGTAKRFHLDQVEVGRNHQVADEFRILLQPDRAERDFGAALHEVEQPDAQIARKTFVYQFQRGHAPTHDSFLRAEVVRANAARIFGFDRFVGLAGHALEQGVNLFLGKKIRHCFPTGR
jgi:hypothetical protein